MDGAIGISLTGMSLAKKGMQLASHNIANSENPNYTRLVMNTSPITLGGMVGGVKIDAITSQVDAALETTLLSKISKSEYSKTLEKTYALIADQFGSPGDGTSIDTQLTNFFGAIERLTLDPTSPPLKTNILNSAESIVTQVSSLAQNLQMIRFNTDQQIAQDINYLNSEIVNLKNAVLGSNATIPGTLERVNADDEVRKSLNKLSEFIDISVHDDKFGNLKVFTKQGYSIVGDIQGVFEYTPADRVLTLLNDFPFNTITLQSLGYNGDSLHIDRTITDMGIGKISALMDLRDNKIPDILSQLDVLAKNIKDQFNMIHNSGVAINAPNKLTGSSLVSRSAELAFTGEVRLAIVDDSGQPIPNLNSLDLNLSNLDTGLGPGKANMQGIMDEIAYHFGDKVSVDNSVAIGDLADVRLVSLTKNILPSSQMTFALEMENLSQVADSIKILGVTATDSTSTNILSSYNNASFTANANSTTRTDTSGPSVVINTGTLQYPYTVAVQVQVTSGAVNHTATVNYVVNNPYEDPTNGVLNRRFAAASATGAATIVAPPQPAKVIEVSLIDSNGDIIATNDPTPGRLVLNGTSKSFHIAIDNLSSSQTGDLSNNIIGTNNPFSYYLGLNDFFVRSDDPTNWGNTVNTAYNFKIRDDIASDPSKIATATLTEVPNLVNSLIPTNAYEVSSGNYLNLSQFSTLIDKTVYFPTAGSAVANTINLSGYAMNITAFATLENQNIKNVSYSDALTKDGLSQRLQNIRGVDVNQEMADIIILQQYFQANAKVMTISKEMFDVLIKTF